MKRIGREVMRFACRDADTSSIAGMGVSNPAAIRALFIYETGNPTDKGYAGAGLAGRTTDAGTGKHTINFRERRQQ